jgi:hypothetical protein
MIHSCQSETEMATVAIYRASERFERRPQVPYRDIRQDA